MVVGVVLPPVVVHPLVEVVGDVEAAVVVGGELEVNQHHGVAVERLLPAQMTDNIILQLTVKHMFLINLFVFNR